MIDLVELSYWFGVMTGAGMVGMIFAAYLLGTHHAADTAKPSPEETR